MGHPVHMISIFKKKKVKPSFSREIVPSEKVLFFIDKKDMPNKKKMIKHYVKFQKKEKISEICGAEVCNYNGISSHKWTHSGCKHCAISHGC